MIAGTEDLYPSENPRLAPWADLRHSHSMTTREGLEGFLNAFSNTSHRASISSSSDGVRSSLAERIRSAAIISIQ